jgi:prevent-host-death family protein
MSHVGVRELKNQLSRYLKRVQEGEEIVVTDHGRSVAKIVPATNSALRRGLELLLREGAVRWAGGKPRGASCRPVMRGSSLADMVIEDRR